MPQVKHLQKWTCHRTNTVYHVGDTVLHEHAPAVYDCDARTGVIKAIQAGPWSNGHIPMATVEWESRFGPHKSSVTITHLIPVQ